MGAPSSDKLGSTVNSRLPGIGGHIDLMFGSENTFASDSALYVNNNASKVYGVNNDTGSAYYSLYFSAARYNSIYGKSSIVQPPAYYVYFWKRIF